MLPVVAVQIAPADHAPALEAGLLAACSAGLERAQCVSARSAGTEPRAIAVVSWITPEHASIEVGLANAEEPVWLSREIEFTANDPDVERWRAVGFTIALLVDDARFWSEDPAPAQPLDTPVQISLPAPQPGPGVVRGAAQAELRALAGVGLVGGPWRWGAELRLVVPISSIFFVTGSGNYALARQKGLDMRWFDASLGLGLLERSVFFADIDGRLRLEVLAENVAASVQRGTLTDRRNAWVPGVSLGGDLSWHLSDAWRLSVRVDAFWLDGSTPVVSAGQRIATSSGAGVILGAGAGYTF